MKARTLIKTGCAALAVLGLSLAPLGSADAASARREPNGAIRYYDDLGQDRGYAWCLRRTSRAWAGGSDCSYYTLAQCQAAMWPPGGDCIPNPFAAYVKPPTKGQHRK